MLDIYRPAQPDLAPPLKDFPVMPEKAVQKPQDIITSPLGEREITANLLFHSLIQTTSSVAESSAQIALADDPRIAEGYKKAYAERARLVSISLRQLSEIAVMLADKKLKLRRVSSKDPGDTAVTWLAYSGDSFNKSEPLPGFEKLVIMVRPERYENASHSATGKADARLTIAAAPTGKDSAAEVVMRIDFDNVRGKEDVTFDFEVMHRGINIMDDLMLSSDLQKHTHHFKSGVDIENFSMEDFSKVLEIYLNEFSKMERSYTPLSKKFN